MPTLETSNLGRIAYEPESVVEFPAALPGFENRHRFVAVRFPDSDPLVFLQNLEDTSLCFVTMPMLAIDPRYRLRISDEDLQHLGLPLGQQPKIADEVMCLAVLAIRESGPTANLLAPLVVNLRNRKAVQAVAPESDYSHQHALMPEEPVVCS